MDNTYLVVAAVRAVRVRVAVLRVVAIRGVATAASVDCTRVACVVAFVARSKSTKQSQEEQKTHR